MVDEKEIESTKEKSSQLDAVQNQLGNVLSGVERSLAVTCESIMDKMKQLEDKIQDMESRYVELAKSAEQALNEAGKCEENRDRDPAPPADQQKKEPQH